MGSQSAEILALKEERYYSRSLTGLLEAFVVKSFVQRPCVEQFAFHWVLNDYCAIGTVLACVFLLYGPPDSPDPCRRRARDNSRSHACACAKCSNTIRQNLWPESSC
ncbi:hypothetical protein RRG08_039392 [Elysia crispata]|uniref:Uncharacterized protein n=1 Tax=Elysia crispata TaxID=231223 RepID=A0AAE1CN15_9GAST|nr:hypothetical protein RRG08_039392 [Elysia crispata]